MTKKNGVNHSMQLSVVARRKSVIERLEKQLIRVLLLKQTMIIRDSLRNQQGL